MFILIQDGTPKASASTFQKACFKLQKMQSFSYDYATKHNGWKIAERKFIVDLPYKGSIQNTITDGIVDYSDGLTFEEYKQQEHLQDRNLEIINSEQLDKLIAEERQDLITEWTEISEERYNEMLGCLPPMNFNGNYFQISEALKYDLRATFIQVGDTYYEATLPTGSAKKNEQYINRI